MEIFKWAKEIEKISEDLIQKAKEANLEEIKNLKEVQEQEIEETVQKKQKVIKSAFKRPLLIYFATIFFRIYKFTEKTFFFLYCIYLFFPNILFFLFQ